ncbi:MAG: YfhO family protein [Deltaproteobacteria bacterium]|nr:MAG: YfhO family protein [Deltaproteobacteria bacterium]
MALHDLPARQLTRLKSGHRIHIGVALVCVATAVAYVVLKLLGPHGDPTDPTSGDLEAYYYPVLEYGFGELRHFRLPFWNPHEGCGTPFLAIPQVGFFYPLYLPFLFLDAASAITLDICLHLAIASFSMFLLCRHFGMRPGPALVAGLVYAHHGGMAIKVYFPNHLAPSAWIPVVFLLADRVLERRSPIACALLGAVLGAAMLGGSPQFVYFTGLALVPFVAVRAVSAPRRDGAGTVAIASALLGAAVALGVLLALVRVLPAAEYMRGTWRPPGSLALEGAAVMSISPAVFAANLLSPAPGPDLGRQAYAGTLPLLLAVVGLALWRPRSAALPIAAAGVAAMLYAFGTHAPLFPLMFGMPAGSWFRAPSRALVVFGFAVALLAGGGLHEVLERAGTGRAARPALLLAGAAASLIGAAAWLRVPEARLLAVNCVAGGVVLLVLLLRPAVRVLAVGVLGVLVVVDLFHGQRPRGVLPAELGAHFARYEPFFGEVRQRQGFARTYIRGRFAPDARLYFHSDLAKAGTIHGIWLATDYEPLCETRFARYLQFPGPPVPWSICYLPLDVSRQPSPLVELMGVRFFMVEDGDGPPPDAGGRWKLVRREGGVSLYEDPGAMPRAFVAADVEVIPDAEALLRRMADANLRRVAFVEETAGETLPAGVGGDAEVERYEANRVAVETRAAHGGLLVLTDRWDAGWKAFVDGTPARVYRTDYLFRGVSVPPGVHTVEFVYRPASFVVGAFGSLLGVVGVVLLCLRPRRTTCRRSRIDASMNAH